MIQSLQKQKQFKPTVDARAGQLQLQSVKSQISQLQKQMARIRQVLRITYGCAVHYG